MTRYIFSIKPIKIFTLRYQPLFISKYKLISPFSADQFKIATWVLEYSKLLWNISIINTTMQFNNYLFGITGNKRCEGYLGPV